MVVGFIYLFFLVEGNYVLTLSIFDAYSLF